MSGISYGLVSKNLAVNVICVSGSGVISSFPLVLNEGKTVNIELESHKSSTRDLVGLQLWRGAFLLAEYICHYENIVKNQNVLELAAGTGFTSLIAALTAKKVICTGKNKTNPLVNHTRLEIDFSRNCVNY